MRAYLCFGLMIIASLIVMGCSSAPSVIKGSVLMRMDNKAHIDLGTIDGIHVGDTLTVFRELPFTSHETRSIRAGLVRVTKMIDERFAVVEVLEGSIAEHDIVEKKMKQ